MSANYVNWAEFWDTERQEDGWLIDGVLAYGRGHSIYAGHKTGKSLVMLALLAELATSRLDTLTIYLDYEMGEDDLYERLSDMGYGPESDLSRLRYALLPSLAPLDTTVGANELCALIAAEQSAHPALHIALVIDTTSRAFQGPENDADTTRNFYRCTGLRLKQMGLTWARLDHAGKNGEIVGARGSSAKGDDVDLVWKLTATKARYTLHREASRMPWVPENTILTRLDNPLRFQVDKSPLPEGTLELCLTMDQLGIEATASVRESAKLLRAGGIKAMNTTISAAVKARKPLRNTLRNTRFEAPGTQLRSI